MHSHESLPAAWAHWYLHAPLFEAPAQVAQLVEQRTENPRVGGSIPSLGTNPILHAGRFFGEWAIIAIRFRETELVEWGDYFRRLKREFTS